MAGGIGDIPALVAGTWISTQGGLKWVEERGGFRPHRKGVDALITPILRRHDCSRDHMSGSGKAILIDCHSMRANGPGSLAATAGLIISWWGDRYGANVLRMIYLRARVRFLSGARLPCGAQQALCGSDLSRAFTGVRPWPATALRSRSNRGFMSN